jgi:hypothetical protein
MNKLLSLRQALLDCPLKIAADKLLTFAEKGTVLSYGGGGNDAFQITYTAKAIVLDYAGAPRDLLFVVAQWLHADNPGAGAESITFTADIISDKAVDVELAVEITETIGAVAQPDGKLRLQPAPDPDALGEDALKSLFADLTRTG